MCWRMRGLGMIRLVSMPWCRSCSPVRIVHQSAFRQRLLVSAQAPRKVAVRSPAAISRIFTSALDVVSDFSSCFSLDPSFPCPGLLVLGRGIFSIVSKSLEPSSPLYVLAVHSRNSGRRQIWTLHRPFTVRSIAPSALLSAKARRP